LQLCYLFYLLVVYDTAYPLSENNDFFLTLQDNTKSNINKIKETCVDDQIKQNKCLSILSDGTALLEKERQDYTGKLGIK